MSDAVGAEEFAQILAETRRFVRSVVLPREAEIADGDRVPDDLRDQAKAMGLFGYAVPPRWGGLGLDLAQDVELAMELGYTSLAVRSMFGTNNGIAGQVLVGYGTDEQKARWLGPIASGEVVASFALTEPGAGSNPAGCAPPRCATATTGGSADRSGSSPTPRSPGCSWSSPAPARRRRRCRHRGVLGARRRRRRRGGSQGRQDGPGGRLDRRCQLHRGAGARRRGDRRRRRCRLSGGDDVVGARPDPHRRAGGRHRPTRPRRIGRLRRHRHPGRHPDR